MIPSVVYGASLFTRRKCSAVISRLYIASQRVVVGRENVSGEDGRRKPERFPSRQSATEGMVGAKLTFKLTGCLHFNWNLLGGIAL